MNFNRLTGAVKKRTWQESFEALKRYKEKHGNCLVPIHNYQEDLALGGWVNHQRSKKSKLTEEQVRKLDSIGFAWQVRARNKTWNLMMEALQKYKSIHGNMEVPEVYQADQKLADFVKEQRAKYHKGQLSAARLKQLEGMGLVLREEADEAEESANISWQRQEEGDQEVVEEGGEEEEEEQDDDEEDQIEYDIKYDNAFKQQYQKLVDFHIKFGHCRVPRFSRRGDTLGLWVSATRRKHRENPAGTEPCCEELLEELGFFNVPEVRRTSFVLPKLPTTSKAAVEDEVSEASNADGEAVEDEEEELGDEDSDDDEEEEEDDDDEEEGADSEAESDTKSLSLSSSEDEKSDDEDETKVEEKSPRGKKRRRESDTSVGRNNYRDERFMKQFNDLMKFKRTHGHCRVPQSKKFKTLGGWVNNLRVMYNRDPENGVRPDRVKLLNEAGFIWNAGADRPGNDKRWDDQYKSLIEFKNKFNHCRVPQTGPHRKLGRWVATQRALYVKDPVNGIRADRLQKLNDIEFTWDAKGFKGRHFYSIAASKTESTMPVSAAKAESSGTESDEDGPAVAVKVEEDNPGAELVAVKVEEDNPGAQFNVHAFRSHQMSMAGSNQMSMVGINQMPIAGINQIPMAGVIQMPMAGIYPPVVVPRNTWAKILPLNCNSKTNNTLLPANETAKPTVPSLESGASETAKSTLLPPETSAITAAVVESQPLVKQVSLD